MSLKFEVAQLRDEVDAFFGLARAFLAPGSEHILYHLKSDLIGISKKGEGSGPARWKISRDSSLRSVTSIGQYMPNDEGGLCVYADISFIWDLEPVRPSGSTQPAKIVRLDGLASTEIRFMEGDADAGEAKEIAVWRMEVADNAAPGCHFHVQVLGRDDDEMFPKMLDVPRLPGSLVSPFACMEFALSELFQDTWNKHAGKDSTDGSRWRTIQEHRFRKQLKWHLETISGTSGSPWVAWKIAKPPEDLFLQ